MIRLSLYVFFGLILGGCSVTASNQALLDNPNVAKSYISDEELINVPIETVKDRMYLLEYKCTSDISPSGANVGSGLVYGLIDEDDDHIVVTRGYGKIKDAERQKLNVRIKFSKISDTQTKVTSQHYLDVWNQISYKKEKDHIIEWALGEHQMCL